jgi:hypothetical protein
MNSLIEFVYIYDYNVSSSFILHKGLNYIIIIIAYSFFLQVFPGTFPLEPVVNPATQA